MSSPGPGARAGTCAACGAVAPPGNAFCGVCGAELSQPLPQGPDDTLLGRVVDNRYRILEKLGQGGMGAVYLAEHVGIGKRMAIKVLRADLRGDPNLARRFRREAMAVSRLTDAHTISVFDYGVWRGLVYLVMEYLRGVDLAQALASEGRLGPERALSIAYQICSSLAEAHSVGLVHRDLKPENVFLTRTAHGGELVKVLDFGLAKMIHPEGAEGLFQTQDGAVLGTPYFMAPEQVRGLPVDGRADLYGLGALLYRMLSGVYAHRGRTPIEVLEAHVSGTPAPLATSAPDLRLPAGCEALVKRLLGRDPADRPASALEVAEEIARIADRADAAAREQAEPAWASTTWEGALPPAGEPDAVKPIRDELDRFERRLRRRSRLRKLVPLLVAGALVGATAWLLTREGPPIRPDEQEPNDEPRLANPLAEGRSIRGFIGRRSRTDRSDRDTYRIQVPPGRSLLSAVLTGVPGLDLVLEAFDFDGRKLFKQDVGRTGEGESVVGVVMKGPEVILIVREVWVDGQAPGENSTDPYHLVVRFGVPSP